MDFEKVKNGGHFKYMVGFLNVIDVISSVQLHTFETGEELIHMAQWLAQKKVKISLHKKCAYWRRILILQNEINFSQWC